MSKFFGIFQFLILLALKKIKGVLTEREFKKKSKQVSHTYFGCNFAFIKKKKNQLNHF